MKNKLSDKEQKLLDEAFSQLEFYINNLAKNESLSLDNIHKAIHQVRIDVVATEDSHLSSFMQAITDNSPMTDWPDVEDDVE